MVYFSRGEVGTVFDSIYVLLRGSIGFSLMVGGATLCIDHSKRQGVLPSFGRLFLAVGALFCFSALDPFVQLPVDLDLFLLVGILYGVGLNLAKVTFFLFGDEQKRGWRRKLARIELGVAILLLILPLFDYVFGWQPTIQNVEDSLARAPLHSAAVILVYILPLSGLLSAIILAKWKPSDISPKNPNSRRLIYVLALVGIVCLGIFGTLLAENRLWYRAGHIALELLLLAIYFAIIRFPATFTKLRQEIGKTHATRLSMSDGEAEIIDKRLATAVSMAELIKDENLDLAALAKRIGIPPYRLSYYFSSRLSTTFPAWLNRLRIDYVCRRLVERPDLSILEVSIEAGYRTKTAFTKQFAKVTGSTPSEYRRLKLGSEASIAR